jgi:DNA-binding MarR family transcriptional regulator
MDTPRPIGFWLKLVDRLIDEQFAATLEEHGITRRQWQLLNVLHAQPATIEQLDAAVAPFLGADETSAEHLTELVESAWVESTAAGYALTDRGRAALDRLSEVVAAQRTAIAEGVSAEQYQATVAVLERMAANLGFEG